MTATFHVGDAIEVMSKLPEKSVDLILTSPPFLALRSYLPSDHPDKAAEGGSQSTPGEFIDWMIDVVEACDRVLAPHGSICIELGDTYAGSGGGGGDYLEGGWREGQAQFAGSAASMKESNAAHWRQKNSNASAWPLAKSLSLIPELFRFTLVYGTNPLTGRTTERWRLRNVVRWVRPNPPVGALGDKFRPATSELMVFCKSAKRYFDLDAVREPHKEPWRSQPGIPEGTGLGRPEVGADRYTERVYNPAGAPPLDWWNIPLLEGEEETRYGPKEPPKATNAGPLRSRAEGTKGALHEGTDTGKEWAPGERMALNPIGAPPLDWWNIPPGGYEGAHYAVFPPELCIKPIKAMCPESVCKICGTPSRRIVERSYEGEYTAAGNVIGGNGRGRSRTGAGADRPYAGDTTGWSNCGCSGGHCSNEYPCPEHWRPGLVLDPFGGSGTTALVATGHGRDCILIDLDERNYELALQRVGPFILERAR